MTTSNQQYRFENKFPLDHTGTREFNYWHHSTGLNFRSHYPDRIVNNIYFDTPNFEAYNDNIEGQSRRIKCRLRWYGDSLSDNEVRFEIKERNNSAGKKQRQIIEVGNNLLTMINSSITIDTIRQCLKPALRPYFDYYNTPVLYNQYRRKYYSTNDGIRMTVDSNLIFKPPYDLDLPAVHSPVTSVVEFKYPVEIKDRFLDYLNYFPFRVMKNSKYVLGIEALY